MSLGEGVEGTRTDGGPDETAMSARADGDGPAAPDGEATDAAEPTRLIGDKPRLVLLSFLMLFVELAIIRWSGANVIFLAYFSNLVLLGSFLGIGLGFIWAGRGGRPLFPWTPVVLALLVAFIRLFPVDITVSGSQLLFFNDLRPSGPPREVILPVIFVVTATVLAFIADGVARTFKKFEPLEAYKLDLVGSVAGIVGFAVLSFLRMPPVVWGIVAGAVLIAVALPKVRITTVLAVGALVAMLGIESAAANTTWSPYYKIEDEKNEAGGYTVKVNEVPHQASMPVADNPLYAGNYAQTTGLDPGDVLIIGAGGGNDVAAALANGADHVDAVEIDRTLYEIGRDGHPDRPYDDPRVDVHIDDGRAFLERSTKDWDRILLALPDSLTLVTGQASVRLESYLFTLEAAESARDHLAPGGVFSMYNYYRERWLVDRYAGTLDEAFGTSPCIKTFDANKNSNLAVLTVSEDPDAVACEGEAQAVWQRPADTLEPARDDHPFPYLRERTLPGFYVATIALILLVSLVAIRGVAGPVKPMLRFTDLFCMGAAFMLLETKSVVQFALLFGTTWFVNALVFLGVLLSVLCAVLVSQRITFKHPARLYLVLLVGLAAAWAVPPSALLELAVVPRFIAAVTLAFLPIFMANLVFTQRFKSTSSSATAFGANLLGAMFGGLLEYASLIVGYRSLLIVVALLYGAAFLTGRKELGATVPGRAVGEPVPAGAGGGAAAGVD
jgi:SAM-dependent methyltransferase